MAGVHFLCVVWKVKPISSPTRQSPLPSFMIIKEIVWSHLGTFPMEKFFPGFGEKAAIFSR